MITSNTYCGFVIIIGRSNVGKSTLLNKLLGQKVSITARKPQTTRYPIIGIYTDGPYQIIYLDTPGLYIEKKGIIINQLKNCVNISSFTDTDLVIFVVESTNWTLDDEIIINKLRKVTHIPIILAINKIDNVFRKEYLLPHIQFLKTLSILLIANIIGI